MNQIASQAGGFAGTMGPNKPDFGSRGNGMPEAKRDETVVGRIARLEATVSLLITCLVPYVGMKQAKALDEKLDIR